MKFKDLLIPITLSLLTIWGIQYFFLKDTHQESTTPRPGQSFVVPPTQQEMKTELRTTFSFTPASSEIQPVKTVVKTAYGQAHFSTLGGALERLDFIRTISGKEQVLTPLNATAPERAAFVLALENQSPLSYTLVDKQVTPENTRLLYRAEGTAATFTKEFTLHASMPRLDLRITVEPRAPVQEGLQLRVFVPAPFMVPADKDFVPMGFVYSANQRLQKQKLAELNPQFWFVPSLFGLEDRYFATALIADQDAFTRRAYYAGTNAETFSFILEGPIIKEPKTWNLSFYYGPKDPHVMEQVDPRLSTTLDYGWLSPLVKILLAILKFLYQYLNNYGWAIIVLTFLIRLLLLPATFKGQKALENQKEFQRKMQYIEQKYKNDQEALNRERMELTRKYGVSNIVGCLPQLAQLPILIALNRLLSTSPDLYQAPFIGWITDLSVRDPYYILPVLAGAGLLVQVTTDADARRGITMLLFAALLVAVTAHLSAGLTLYLCANTWLSIGQTYLQKVLKI